MKTLLAFLVLALAAIPGWTQEKSVGGLVINLGLMPASKAMQVGGHREAHEHAFTNSSGAEHLLITLADAKTGARIGDAQVVVEVRDPIGKTERRELLKTQAAGLPDYSEIFQFGSSGNYAIRVRVTPKPGARPFETRFTVNHSI